MWDSWHQLEPFGYTEQELLVSGTARAADGSTAPYTTRVVITRPQRQRDFNGAVMLEWVNVTAQFENAVDSLEGLRPFTVGNEHYRPNQPILTLSHADHSGTWCLRGRGQDSRQRDGKPRNPSHHFLHLATICLP